jgi:hypothetical protein
MNRSRLDPIRVLGAALGSEAQPKPYAPTLARFSRFDFVIPREAPSDFASRPLVFVGIIVPPQVMTAKQTNRPWAEGMATIPSDNKNRPDFAHALCAPPVSNLTP